MHNGNIITDTDIVLDTWKNDFEKVYNPSLENIDVAFAKEIEKQKHNLENIREAEFQTTLNNHILLEEVEKAISHCKNNKAPGIYQIPNEVIKNPFIKLFHALFVYCFNNSVEPKMWLRSLIKPIPKNSNKNHFLPQNYRGISLISYIAKIYSSLLNSWLTSFLEDTNTLILNGNFYNAIIALYKETESCFQINNFTTTWFSTLQGVRQVDNLLPTLFNIFLNYLTKELKKVELGVSLGHTQICILLYADDIVLIVRMNKIYTKCLTMLVTGVINGK